MSVASGQVSAYFCSHRVKTKPRSKHTQTTQHKTRTALKRSALPRRSHVYLPLSAGSLNLSPVSALSAPRAHTKALSHHSPLKTLSLAPALSPTRPHTAHTPKKIANLSSLHSLYSSNTHTKTPRVPCVTNPLPPPYRRLPTVPSPLLPRLHIIVIVLLLAAARIVNTNTIAPARF